MQKKEGFFLSKLLNHIFLFLSAQWAQSFFTVTFFRNEFIPSEVIMNGSSRYNK